MTIVFLTQVATTLILVGLIWFVQIVHYPLFNRVGADLFAAYEVEHTRLTLLIVSPLMLLEAATAFLLLWYRPAGASLTQLWFNIGLVLLIWLSTAFLQIPQHNVLSLGFDEKAYRKLVVSNWLRTAAWSVKGLLALWMVAQVMA